MMIREGRDREARATAIRGGSSLSPGDDRTQPYHAPNSPQALHLFLSCHHFHSQIFEHHVQQNNAGTGYADMGFSKQK
jgi:hypothetical protein